MTLALFTGAHAQSGTTQPKEVVDPAQQPVELQRSHYNDCLLTASNATWTALGLNSDQVTRIAEVQSRYKSFVNPPKEATKEKSSKKKSASTATKEDAAADTKTLDKSAVNDAVAPTPTDIAPANVAPEAAPADNTSVEGAASAMALPPVSFDEELRGILTPEQWSLWDKRCAETSMK